MDVINADRDNDSNGYMYADPAVNSAFEVIEIEPSDDDDESAYHNNEVANKFRVPSNGNCGHRSPSAGSSGHHNPYEPSGGSGPDVVTTTNDLGNGTNWYEEKMDEGSLLPPPPEITIEQCRSGNGCKMPTIESVLPGNGGGHHQQQSQPQMPLHMTPLMGGGRGGGATAGPGSVVSGNILTPELVYANGGGASNVKDLINAEVTIEPISGGNRGVGHHHHLHQHHHQQQQPHSSAQQQLLDNVVGDNRKPLSSNELPPVLTPINDPIELYCLSLVDCLRAMPRSERERVKFEFAKILKDAVYKDEA